DATVTRVEDEDLAGVTREVRRKEQVAIALARATHRSRGLAIGVEDAHAMELPFDHVDPSVGSEARGRRLARKLERENVPLEREIRLGERGPRTGHGDENAKGERREPGQGHVGKLVQTSPLRGSLGPPGPAGPT